ncbi:DUF1802 family protein [aff. Roholtiella sp. LEGE 12411]|uniref:DUF1802 family protein n=1 Tax=aff. Roholtiella sp. LEGE 12411 TaxID=1828822 RepID=UPI001880E091|nr:DUF1802 family protein [aff. Roholtiella sp. LEGE 12411]MBE9037101.1 DUF1802 family protein [aff. Roholtiella sp. LEGE 12411]
MNSSVVINTAICLPAPDTEALIQGRAIVAMCKNYIVPERQFALYPTDASINILPVEQYYQLNFLAYAKTALAQVSAETISVKAWARCEKCEPLQNTESLSALSPLTVWTTEALQEILTQRHNIFLLYLRVFQQPLITLSIKVNSQFIYLGEPLTISEAKPVLNDRTFAQRKHQLENRQPPLHPELEELQSAIASLTLTNSAAKELNDDIKIFLGWSSNQPTNPLDLDLAWIQKIAQVGNSSDGHTFEKLVRRGLLKLGFTGSGLNPDATGGAGGMDFYAEQPYPIVGECKATKSEKVSDGTPAQLLKIGINHLGKVQYESSIKLIVAAGELNFYALRTATENQMNVISPETLQKLVELQAHYKNSINLLELKEYLQQAPFGLAEDKVNTYIEKVEQSIKLRSHIIQLVKKHLEKTDDRDVGVDSLHVAYIYDNPPQSLTPKELYEIMIELSSPLTGYLGRDKKSDRFYYLRDLPINLK